MLKSQGRLGLSFGEFSGELSQESAIDLFAYSAIQVFITHLLAYSMPVLK
jgi:hypothetical protein